MKGEVLEGWMRMLPGIYHHSTEETKKQLLKAEPIVIGSEYMNQLLSIPEDRFQEICATPKKDLTLLKELNIDINKEFKKPSP